MPEDPKTPRESTPREETPRKDPPRTDLPPEREPYDEGYFGTEEEEGIVREQEAPEGTPGPAREEDQENAGGDREIG